MRKFLSIILMTFIILNFSICYADTKMKLYRNKEYQFSIEIPECYRGNELKSFLDFCINSD